MLYVEFEPTTLTVVVQYDVIITASKVRLVTLELSVTLMRVAMCGTNGASSRYAPDVNALRARAAALARNFYKCDDIFLDMFEDE